MSIKIKKARLPHVILKARRKVNVKVLILSIILVKSF